MAILDVQGVSKGFGGLLALNQVFLKVKEGSVHAIIGPNGAGKSTLLRLLLGILKPQKGIVSLFGKPPGKHGQPIGYVPQGINLPRGFPLSVEDVVLMGRYGNLGPVRRPSRTDRDQVKESLDQVGMAHLARRRFEDLSGGQQQRVLIARALVGDPAIVLADEPTGNLDSKNSQAIIELIEELNASGTTIVVITHNREIAESFPRVIGLLDGRIEYDRARQEVV